MSHGSFSPGLPTPVSQKGSSIFLELAAQFRAWTRRREIYNRTFRELASCSDRDLDDISIARLDIPRIAAEAARMASGSQLQ